MVKNDGRGVRVLATAYASLPLLAFLAYSTSHIHIGALAVIPILFISYYVRPYAALLTASITGMTLGLLDQGPVSDGHLIDLPPLMDALVLSVALCAVVLVANRLREAAATNELLHGRLIKARRDADHDALTGLVNRSYFFRKLDDAIALGREDDQCIAVLFCDLDRFKAVNDKSGHAAGDHVLRLAAERLTNAVRAVDTVARLGGDEFAVLVEHVRDGEEALHLASKIERAFADPIHVANERYAIGITVGVSLYPNDGTRPDALLHIADARMYRTKYAKRAAAGVAIAPTSAD